MASQSNTNTKKKMKSQALFYQQGSEIQEYGTVRLMPIALSNETRIKVCETLNQILADTQILFNLYKKHHWLMRGPTFLQLHELLDTHAGELLAHIDELAERIQSLGGVAIGDPRHVAEITKIERPPNGVEEVPVMISRLLAAHETILEEVRKAIDETDELGDMGTNDLLAGDTLRMHEKQVWFLSEHLVDTPIVRA
jgi:starvation-inducible DNA-binding protein